LAEKRPGLIDDIEKYARNYEKQLDLVKPPVILKGGEQAKNDQMLVNKLIEMLLENRIDRQSFVIAVGGGAILDMVGYAAAIFHRGIRLIRIPTTVLSQNDSGVGVKNGINAYGIKNLLGTFVPPFAVINDIDLIRTLEPRDKRAGMAEAVKVSLIRDKNFFCWLENSHAALSQFETDAMAYMIRRCAELHMNHIATNGDPFELGSSRPLDFGHWAAHKLENLTQYEVRHGEAVAIGIALDTRYSYETGLLDHDDCERVISLMENLGFRLWHPQLEATDGNHNLLLSGLQEFQEHLGGDFTITLLSDLGRLEEVNAVDNDVILSICQWLKDRDSKRS
jgi:3-dehydroquinate synthase